MSLTAERAQENPHRITAVTIDFAVTGDVPKDQIQRAIDLSHEKYCSVWHSMRQDIPFTTTVHRRRMTDAAPGRRTYLDVLRGVAVLIMIEAHVIDAGRAGGSRVARVPRVAGARRLWRAAVSVSRGVAVAMSAGSKARRTRRRRRRRARGPAPRAQIFVLAFLFRFQSFVLSHAPAWTLLKVDILNIMGPSIVLGGDAVGLAAGRPRARLHRSPPRRWRSSWLTPLVRATRGARRRSRFARGLPPAHSRPDQFHVLPLDGFVMAGALVGVLLDARAEPEADRRVNLALRRRRPADRASGLPGVVPAAARARSSFWTTLGELSSSFAWA